MTTTQLLPATPANITAAARLLRAGSLVAFPTETVYGLGADALNPAAAARIFSAKGRPAEDPLIVHIHTLSQLNQLASQVSEPALALMEAFWPGPLTLVLPKTSQVDDALTAGLPFVAIRMPNHPVALQLLRQTGRPVAAPSANLFGHTSPTSASHVLADLNGRIEAILDGGECTVGVESTVLHMGMEQPTLLRPGGVPREAIEQVIGPVALRGRQHQPAHQALPSPGLLDRHYAPHTPLTFVTTPMAPADFANLVAGRVQAGRKVGVLAYRGHIAMLVQAGATPYDLGHEHDPAAVASQIYAGLRWLDSQHLDELFALAISPAGLGLAINDRLSRAAERVV